ncbi:MAG: hypothetical protein J7J76_01280 [Candidatus Latescibacteria bacterium]|nr:hypothetical protein [Candidatus Latescibacterota bacterium]
MLREDSFTALEAERQGECWIVPVSFKGDRLTVSAWAPFAGYLRIGLVSHPDGKPIAGYAAEDSDPIVGDALCKRVTWRGKSDLSVWTCK